MFGVGPKAPCLQVEGAKLLIAARLEREERDLFEDPLARTKASQASPYLATHPQEGD